MINVGVIGCGYWGPNILRNRNEITSCTITKLCDLKEVDVHEMPHEAGKAKGADLIRIIELFFDILFLKTNV